MANKCVLKNCKRHKQCTLKKDPFQNNKICEGYKEYIHQDEIRKKGMQFEVVMSETNIEENMISNEILDYMYKTNKSKKELIVQMFFFDDIKDIQIIKEQLFCSEQYIYSIIRKCKNKLMDKIMKKGK